MKSHFRLFRILCCALLSAFAASAWARPGDLDLRFNPSGINGAPWSVQLVIPNVSTSLRRLSILPDGKILAMGLVQSDLALSRWLPDGSLDTTFGTGGVVLTPRGFAENAWNMAVQSDGRIVVTDYPVRAVRFLADGPLDASFGTGGMATVPPPPDDYGVVTSVAVMSDGKILLGGSIQRGLDIKPGLWRLQPDGRADQTFGAAGSITLPVAGATIRDLQVQLDGKIAMTGALPFESRAWLARCDAKGALDSSFGNAGSVVVPELPGGVGTDPEKIALQSDGKYVILGLAFTGPKNDFFLARFNHDGSPDATFGESGSVVTRVSSGSDYALGLAMQADGKLVVSGKASNKLVVARYLPDGKLDNGFGKGGISIPIPENLISSGNAVALQADGRIVAGGEAYDSGVPGSRLKLVRVDGDLPETLSGEWPAGTTVANGGTVQLSVLRGDPSVQEAIITLRNTGTSPLINPVATLSGPGAARFTMTSTLPPVLNAGATATITVRFLPASQVSSFDAFIRVDPGTPDFATYVVFLHGETLLPVATLTLWDGPQAVIENSTLDIGSTIPSRPMTRVFTIKNAGVINLQVQGILLGTDGTPGDFAVGQPGTTDLEPRASTTFSVTFTPSGPGERTAKLHIASTDTIGLPYVITLAGRLAEGIEAWRLRYFGTAQSEGPGADGSDLDHDGVANLVEYATSTDPTAPGTPPGSLSISGDTIEYTFTRPADAVNYLRYSLESTVSLSGPWAETGARVVVLSDDGELQQVKFTLPAGTGGRRFVRMRVTVK